MPIKDRMLDIVQSNQDAIGLLILNQNKPDAIKGICEALTYNQTALKRLIKVMESK